MLLTKIQARIARSVVVLLCAGFIQTGLTAPAAHAATPIEPTISSITSGATSLTVNMVTSGIDATQWRWAITKRSGVSCVNTYGDSVVQSTGSLSSTISITGLTAGCVYSVKVAGYNGVIGDYNEMEKLVGGFTNGLTRYTKNETGLSAVSTHVPFTSGTCESSVVANISFDYAGGSPTGCNTDGFTSYYVGYLKAPTTETVTLKASSDDGFYVNIQGQNVISYASEAAASTYNATGTIKMVANEIYRIEVWHHEYNGNSSVQLWWSYPGQADQIIPTGSLATDPSVFFGTCPLGVAARCSAGSAYEIKQATGTNMDGQYWIDVAGTPTLIYCIMNSAMKGGGWMLAMKGKQSGSTYSYASSYWTDANLLNQSYPQRWKASDTDRDVDAKYGVFTSNKTNQIMALFPQQTTYAGGAIPAATTGNTTVAYGFNWIETTTAGRTWTSSDGDSWNVNSSGTGGPNGSSCVTTATTLRNLFTNSARCAFRVVSATYSSTESPYSAIGDNLFYTQANIRFFGINYANRGGVALARWGFGWNENGATDEGSNDGSGGIGITYGSFTSITTGSINNCCATKDGISGGGTSGSPATSTNIPFEMYIRNVTSATINGNNLRVVYKRANSLVAGNGYGVTGATGTPVYRLSPAREGFSIDSSTGKITVSEGVAIGDYTMTVSMTDTDGVASSKSVTVQVLAESSDTDTALTFNGTNYLATSGTYGLWADQTHEAWVRADIPCTQTDSNKTAFGNSFFVVFCNSGYWWTSFKDNSDAWNGMQTNRRVVSGEWIHIAVVRLGTTVYMYFNNTQGMFWAGTAWAASYTQTTVKNSYSSEVIGGTGNTGQYFTGLVDELKIWDSARTQSQIWAGAHVRADVSDPNLLGYWDFNEGSGTAISRSQRLDNNFSFAAASNQWVSIAQTATDGPYTVVTIPRTLINNAGGWRSPDSITAMTVTLVGGGGGGGGGYQGGGGGAGGFIETQVAVVPKTIYGFVVGMGGAGTTNPLVATNGETTTAFGLSAIGGGRGASEFDIAATNTVNFAQSGGSGGGGTWGTKTTSDDNFIGGAGTPGQGFAGGNSTRTGSSYLQGAGGGGASAIGGAPDGTKGGNGGAGKYSNVLKAYLAGGGGGSHRLATTSSNQGLGGNGGGGSSAYIDSASVGSTGGASPGTFNTGGGGGAGLALNGSNLGRGAGGNGGSGVIAFRWITALKPTFTQPTIAYLNAGMSETFSVNVAQDSATAVLTRSFRWESTTGGSSGTYSLLKQGTGAANASFSWIPSDTSTSGNMYLYRVIVTDSDTAGLFIQDTSTAVYAVINQTLVLVGKSTVSKTVNISKTETFTVSTGTPTYRYSLTPTSPYFWLDTSTVGSPRLKFADTVTVGTYYETITVTDSVSASYISPLTIVISAPPSFSASAEQVDQNTVLYLDAANTSSYSGSGTAWTDISGSTLSTTLASNMTGKLAASTYPQCSAPSYASDNVGVLNFSSTSTNINCAYTANIGLLTSYTIDTWFKRNGAQTPWAAIVSNPYSVAGKQINMAIFWNTSSTIMAGRFDGANWVMTGNSVGVTVPDNTWTHVIVLFNGSTLRMIVNGDTTTADLVSASTTWDTSKLDSGLVIGRKWDGDIGFNGTIGSLRIYNRTLTMAEVSQNYNATKGRFLLTQNKTAPSGKYGTRVNETYTVTAGSETITASFTSNAVAGLVWDTSTVRSMKVQLQESLTAGTYYDTITVTDIYGASTRIPLTISIAKADTLTVYIDTPTALNYTGTNALIYPDLRVTGLASSDVAGSVASIKYRPGGTTCATGGACAVGDIGPGGGIVFITPSTAGGNGKYFEAAPFNWAGADDLGTIASFCSNPNSNIGSTNVGIGWGDTNTALARTACLGGAVAKVNTFNGANNTGYSDWFIPSKNEAIELAKVSASTGLLNIGSNWSTGNWGYWSSTEVSASTMYSIGHTGSVFNGTSSVDKSDSTHNMVRPVRSFTPCWALNACSSFATTAKPINAGVYAITVETLTLTSGLLSNYVAVKYDTTTVTINKVNQQAQNSTIFETVFPDTFTLFMTGGSGNGAISYTLISGGTATGCTLDYKKVGVSSLGTCNIQVVRLGDRNYYTDTATVYTYFVTFGFSQPSPQPGTGPNIALTGVTSLTLESNVAPTISAVNYVPYECRGNMCVPQHWEIIGVGFGAYDNTNTIVKFWRNKVLDWFPAVSILNYVDSDTKIWIRQLPAGATTGKITVTTANGIAVSPDFFVVP